MMMFLILMQKVLMSRQLNQHPVIVLAPQVLNAMIKKKNLYYCRIVEDDGFCRLINFFAPDYKIPCRDTITRRKEKIFEDEQHCLVKELEKVHHVAVSTDGWTSQQTQKLFAPYTVAFIDIDSGKYKNKVLSTNKFSKAHTGVIIHEDMEETFKYFNLSGI